MFPVQAASSSRTGSLNVAGEKCRAIDQHLLISFVCSVRAPVAHLAICPNRHVLMLCDPSKVLKYSGTTQTGRTLTTSKHDSEVASFPKIRPV